MEITLRKIKYNEYDNLKNKIDITNFFDKSKNVILNVLEESSENVIFNNKEIKLNINPYEYLQIIRLNENKAEASAKIGELLHQQLRLDNNVLPNSILYEKEVWTYLNLKVFFDVIEERFFYKKDNDNLKHKIEQYYFNCDSKIDRTGFRYYWVLANTLYYNDAYDLVPIAMKFIDTYRAINESDIGKNSNILKAFVLSIKDLNYNNKIKNEVNRLLIPLHLRNYACAHSLDSYGDDIVSLSQILSEQINIIIEDNEQQDYYSNQLKKRKEQRKKQRK